MHDVEIWETLLRCHRTPEAEVGSEDRREQVREALCALSAVPLKQRFPFLGLLRRLLTGTTGSWPEAFQALTGADGYPALQALVGGLDSSRPAERESAVDALAGSIHRDPGRWVHALFHRDVNVRRNALSLPDDAVPSSWLRFLLLADPELRDEVLRTFPEKLKPTWFAPALLEFEARGWLPQPMARSALAGHGQQSMRRVIQAVERGSRRGAQREQAVIAAVRAHGFLDLEDRMDLGIDALDRLFMLFWEPPDGVGEDRDETFRGFWDELLRWEQRRPSDLHPRVVASVIACAARRRRLPGEAAGLLALIWSDFLVTESIPLEVRRTALPFVLRHGERSRLHSVATIRSALTSPLCRIDGEADKPLDLLAIGALLRLAGKRPYRLVQDVFPLHELLESFQADPKRGVHLFSAPDDTKGGRQKLIDKVLASPGIPKTYVVALLVPVLSSNELHCLSGLSIKETIEVFVFLLSHEQQGHTLPDKKNSLVARTLGGPRLARRGVKNFLDAWLAQCPVPSSSKLGCAILAGVAKKVPPRWLISDLRRLPAADLHRILVAVSSTLDFPYVLETALARELADHADASVREWAAARIPPTRAAPPPRRSDELRVLKDRQIDEIATCSDSDLESKLARCLRVPTQRLCDALERRFDPAEPNAAACLALLACHDSIDRVAEQFRRFGRDDDGFLSGLDSAAVETWLRTRPLPLHGHCWLHRWDFHADLLTEKIKDGALDLAEVLSDGMKAAHTPLGREIWAAVARLTAIWRWRHFAMIRAVVTPAVVSRLCDGLPTALGTYAAEALVRLHKSGLAAESLAASESRVVAMLPSVAPDVRTTLQDWIDVRGLVGKVVTRPAEPTTAMRELADKIDRMTDLGELSAYLRHDDLTVVRAACLRLIELGRAGIHVLMAALAEATGSADRPTPGFLAVISETVAQWPDGKWTASLQQLALDQDVAPEIRFNIAVGLLTTRGANVSVPAGDRDTRTLLDALIDAANREVDALWLGEQHLDRLAALGTDERWIGLHLAPSPHPCVYRLGVQWLVQNVDPTDHEIERALAAFLRSGANRLASLRVQAAGALQRVYGNHLGFPLLLAAAVELEPGGSDPLNVTPLLSGWPAELVQIATWSCLMAGPDLVPEVRLIRLLWQASLSPAVLVPALLAVLASVASESTRHTVIEELRAVRGAGHPRLDQLARVFAWGVLKGRELCHRSFRVVMHGGDELGYTRFEESKVYITPLPVLRGERDSEDVTKGLILHELGHHVYHRGDAEQSIWDRASNEGMHPLLNLVADEHLERNLRADSRHHGNLLKRLNAYGFLHNERDVEIDPLLLCLQDKAFSVLTNSTLGVARRRGCVHVRSGQIHQALETVGSSFARFVRALRMGLGNRYHDPKVEQALRLFGRDFRKSSMEELLAIAYELREIFGQEVELLQALALQELATGTSSELVIVAEGLSEEELQKQIEKHLETRQAPKPSRDPTGRRVLNLSPTEDFEPITNIVEVSYDPVAYRRIAARIIRHARQMRRYLIRLGLGYVPHRRRTTGRAVDRTRLRQAVVLGDPRFLMARRLVYRTDLFMGLIIDCSESMVYHDNIRKAQLFGTLLAEAARDNRGIDVRVFGFNDSVIFDAGDAERCAAHALSAGGGNNDAAALLHTAQVAASSQRRRKLLVMISDGLPTECSVDALKGLVSMLARRGFSCAQVAVEPLEVICFPHYVQLGGDDDLDRAVARFGRIVTDLVGRTVGAR